MRYRLSKPTENDLREIWLYVAGDASIETADQLLEAIGQRFERLARNPWLSLFAVFQRRCDSRTNRGR